MTGVDGGVKIMLDGRGSTGTGLTYQWTRRPLPDTPINKAAQNRDGTITATLVAQNAQGFWAGEM